MDFIQNKISKCCKTANKEKANKARTSSLLAVYIKQILIELYQKLRANYLRKWNIAAKSAVFEEAESGYA